MYRSSSVRRLQRHKIITTVYFILRENSSKTQKRQLREASAHGRESYQTREAFSLTPLCAEIKN
jgi:hypothetical protein